MSNKNHHRHSNNQPHVLAWEGREYPRLDAGVREVFVTEIQGPERVHRYRRWSLRVGCVTIDEPGEVSAFFNLGTGDKPCLGRSRQSRIYKLIVLALGRAPEPGEKIDFNDLLMGKYFIVRIEDSTLDSTGQEKADGEVYSRITEFVRLAGPHSLHP